MTRDEIAKLTDEELLVERKKLKNSKIFHASVIGFLGGVLLFGTVSWFLNPDRNFTFWIIMALPIIWIYRIIKNRNKNKDLKDIQKERNLA